MPFKINPVTGNLDYYEVPGSGGGGGANLTFVPGATNGVIVSDSGTDATIPLTNGTSAGLFSPEEKLRLQIALTDDVVFRGLYSDTAFYANGDVVEHFETLYQRTSSPNEAGLMPPSPVWGFFDPLLGADAFDAWIRTALGNRLISQGINYNGDYNNASEYSINSVVRTPAGSPYGLPGQLFIRVSNPGNPGYPPGTSSWELYDVEIGSPAFDYWIRSVLGTKVTVEIGKGLSTEDYTTAEQTKLAGIAEGAEVNVNPDWLATSGDAQILNKPASIPTANVKHSVKYAEALTIGQAVYVSGASGTNMLVSKADNSTEATSSKTLGLVTASGAANYQGEVITEGLLAGLDTSTATDGDAVWLGTNGNLIFWHYGLTTKPVAPAHLVFIGIVTRVSATVGEIFVKPQNGFELDELHDVLIVNPTNDQVVAYDLATGLWKNKTIAVGSGEKSGSILSTARSLPFRMGTNITTYRSASGVGSTVVSSTTFAGESTHYFPISLKEGSPVNAAAFRVNSAGSGGLGTAEIEVGIYNSTTNANGELIPGTLEVQFGKVSILSTGVKEAVLASPYTLGSTVDNIYFIAFRSYSTNSTSLNIYSTSDVLSSWIGMSSSSALVKLGMFIATTPYTAPTGLPASLPVTGGVGFTQSATVAGYTVNQLLIGLR